YRIDALPRGNYHVIGQSLDGPVEADEIATAHGSYSGLVDTTPPFRTHVAMRAASQLIPVFADKATSLGFFVSPNLAPALTPRLIGMIGDLTTVAFPFRPGRQVTGHVAG